MFKCMECGRKFKTVKAAERAAFGPDGCPGCGGSDIGEAPLSDGDWAETVRLAKAAMERRRLSSGRP